MRRIHDFPAVELLINRFFGSMMNDPPVIGWKKTHLFVAMSIKITSDQIAYEEFLDRIDLFYNVFTHDATNTLAKHGTLNTVMYHSGEHNYEYILDNLRFKIRSNTGKILRNIIYPRYWK